MGSEEALWHMRGSSNYANSCSKPTKYKSGDHVSPFKIHELSLFLNPFILSPPLSPFRLRLAFHLGVINRSKAERR